MPTIMKVERPMLSYMIKSLVNWFRKVTNPRLRVHFGMTPRHGNISWMFTRNHTNVNPSCSFGMSCEKNTTKKYNIDAS